MENFFDYYELYNSTTKFENIFNKSSSYKICRFCNRTSPAVTFNNIPHIIPELFGRNKITSNFECDSCNRKFQNYENDTATMIQHYLALTGIKSKNGIPTFKSNKINETYSTTLKTTGNERNIFFGTNLSDFEYDEKNKKFIIRFRTRRFRPFSVYKVFLKIGISLLSDEHLKKNEHFLEFLNSEKPIENGMQIWTVFRYMKKTKYVKTPKADLFKAKKILIENSEFPEYILILQFANVAFQFFLPISVDNMEIHNSENTLRVEMFPLFAYEDLNYVSKLEIYDMELSETNKVSITDEIILHYERKTKKGNNT